MAALVKICGITNPDDARVALEVGADALGFIFFAGSPRCIQVNAAAEIISRLPSEPMKVGVFVDESVEVIDDIVQKTGITHVQLHGRETTEFCQRLRHRVIKAFRIKDQGSLADLHAYRVHALLLDSYVPGQLGGTGALFNWDLAIQAKLTGPPIILAGGLTPDNVADAVAKVSPYAVDVSSGVESSPGKKDHAKVREFIRRAKS